MNDHPEIPESGKPAEAGPSALANVVLVTGMSGAGKSSALKALEDLGYEAVDNLPLSLLADLVGTRRPHSRPLAIGADIRTQDFAVAPFIEEIDRLMEFPGIDIRMLFLDCDNEVLRRRYTETRRRHPLAADRRVTDGIRRERTMISPLMERADLTLDTSQLELHDLRRILTGHFEKAGASPFTVFVMSFSYRQGLPREADLVFDVRFLKNPHYQEDLRNKTGLDQAVGEFIAGDPDFSTFFNRLTSLLTPLLPRYKNEGKTYLTIAVGCTGGRHRSVYVAERLRSWLQDQKERVNIAHREIAEA